MPLRPSGKMRSQPDSAAAWSLMVRFRDAHRSSPPNSPPRAAASGEAGALRIVVALALAMVVTIGIGAAFGVAAAIAVAVVAVAAGFAFEIRHTQF
jgi:hypothetical protein